MFGARKPRWSYRLLDADDNDLGALDGVKGGSVTTVALSRLGGSGELTIGDTGQTIDWLSHRIQITYNPGIAGVDGWPVATMLLSSPTERHTATGVEYDVGLLPKTAVIDEDGVEAMFSLAAGTPIISTVVALIESTGETRVAVTPSPAVLMNPLVWEAGTSKLTIVNELLEAAGYWSLWCDGSGQYRVEPYLLPSERPVTYSFVAGEASIHKPEWSRDQDLANVPNRFVVVGQGDDETPPLVGVAVNEDPDSPFSPQNRGTPEKPRWITATEEGVEGESQTVFDQLAQRRLLDAMSPVAKLEVVHAIIPLEPNQLVRFSPSRGRSRLATIQSMKYRLEFDAQCEAGWREA